MLHQKHMDSEKARWTSPLLLVGQFYDLFVHLLDGATFWSTHKGFVATRNQTYIQTGDLGDNISFSEKTFLFLFCLPRPNLTSLDLEPLRICRVKEATSFIFCATLSESLAFVSWFQLLDPVISPPDVTALCLCLRQSQIVEKVAQVVEKFRFSFRFTSLI